MKGLRSWILLLALVSFLTGLAAGWTGAEISRADLPASSAFGAYERELVRTFELDPRRQHLLAELLDHYNREIEEIQNRYTAEVRHDMEPELRRVGREYRSHLRDHILPPSRRAEFDALEVAHQDTF